MPSIDDLPEDEPLEVTLDDYGFTGEAYARLEDGWLSVRGAMPGERVRVEVEPQGPRPSRRRWAKLLEVLEPGPHRRDPMCEHADRCRGCHLRHMTVQEERRFKSEAVAEVMERYAGIAREAQPPVTVIAHEPMMRGDAERIRSSLTVRPRPLELGLRAPGSELIPMDDCPALTAPVRRLISQVRACLEETDARDLVRVKVASAVHGLGLVQLEYSSELGLEAPALELLGERLPERVGVFVKPGEEEPWIHVRGPRRMRLPIGEFALEVGAEDWFHATLRPAEALYDHLLEVLAPEPEDAFLDVGCGVGTISLLMASRAARVVGLDGNLRSVETARENAERLGREASFHAGSWENGLRRLMLDGESFELATINPMREPLGERAMRYINQMVGRRVVYLGPSPVSAARDLVTMLEADWSLTGLSTVMLHPATYHTMLFAVLER